MKPTTFSRLFFSTIILTLMLLGHVSPVDAAWQRVGEQRIAYNVERVCENDVTVWVADTGFQKSLPSTVKITVYAFQQDPGSDAVTDGPPDELPPYIIAATGTINVANQSQRIEGIAGRSSDSKKYSNYYGVARIPWVSSFNLNIYPYLYFLSDVVYAGEEQSEYFRGTSITPVITQFDDCPTVANDKRINATPLTFPYSSTVSNVEWTSTEVNELSPTADNCTASIDSDLPEELPTISNSVWYRMKVTEAGRLLATTANSTYDTVLTIYRRNVISSIPFYTVKVCNDDHLDRNFYSQVDVELSVGTYYIQIADFGQPLESAATLTFSATFTGKVDTQIEVETPTPTVELLTNGDFENDTDSNQIPDGWTGKKLNVDGKDKIKCNKSGKTFAQSGNCAFMFKGNADGGKSTLSYTVTSPSVITDGSTLAFSAWVNPRNTPQGTNFAQVTVKFSSGEPLKLSLTLPASDGYSQVIDTAVMSLSGRTLQEVKVDFSHKGTRGKFLLDNVSLVTTTNSTMIPLPSAP
jgi:hypothetical protein